MFTEIVAVARVASVMARRAGVWKASIARRSF